ncbi:MAG: DNA-directed RNA polymerase subunit beta' [Mollicutes bacterium PWAP]|nr:DNA-directed RNA polymerase subunit beta' [Mollicutes bacterium PWAP]
MSKNKQVILKLATKEDILNWSYGEVTKPETINYKTYKPEKKGLFDEIIFGPSTDFKCSVCAYKYKRSDEGEFCIRTASCRDLKPEILPILSKRSRMGHIALAVPVLHFWFNKIDHSVVTKLLGLRLEGSNKLYPKGVLDNIVYFRTHILTQKGNLNLKENKLLEIGDAAVTYREIILQILENHNFIKNEAEKGNYLVFSQKEDIAQKRLEELETEFNRNLEITENPETIKEKYYEMLSERKAEIKNYKAIIKGTASKKRISKVIISLKEEIDLLEESIDVLQDFASGAGQTYGIDFYEYNELIKEFSLARVKTGVHALVDLFKKYDIDKEIDFVSNRIDILEEKNKISTKADQKKQYQRLKLLYNFKNSGQDINSLLLWNVPVIPSDLRPLVQIDGGKHSTSDINELYRRVIIRNNRLKKWIELDAPELLIQNESRMIQESVDALIDNNRKAKNQVMTKEDLPRPLKSIADTLTGKKGRFRQNLLGKRVDYSGRSVIVVGPDLKMHQMGLPRGMAAKLFEPIIIKLLLKDKKVENTKAAKNLIKSLNPEIWPYVEKAIEDKVVLLNRAPTLHRLSIQAFEPVLTRGKAMRLHPLVTAAFNADFDGDQMAVHVPLSDVAIRESKELMLANKNILGPKDGEPIINPSQDIILGIYYLTKEIKETQKNDGRFFNDYKDVMNAFNSGILKIHNKVLIPASNIGKNELISEQGYILTTVGKLIFNSSFPASVPFIFNSDEESYGEDWIKYAKNNFYIIEQGSNIKEIIKKQSFKKPIKKSDIASIIQSVFYKYVSVLSKGKIASVIDVINFSNYQDTLMAFSKLNDYKGDKLNHLHALSLSDIVRDVYKVVSIDRNETDVIDVDQKAYILEKVWFEYTNIVANVLDNIKDLGFKYSMLSGITISISDIKTSGDKNGIVEKGNIYVDKMNVAFVDGLLTDNERYKKVVDYWTKAKNEVSSDLKVLTEKDENLNNPIFTMMASGARGNINNFTQLAGMRGLMANNKKQWKVLAAAGIQARSTIEVPVKSSFMEGLTSFEFYSSTHGARKGLTDTALNTANSGYLTRRLVDAVQNVTIKEIDCGVGNGSVVKAIMNTNEGIEIESLSERIEGRYLSKDVKVGKVLFKNKTLITPKMSKLISKNHDNVEIRSTFECQTIAGICKLCYGKDLATNRVVEIGEVVGIIAAQSIGEPGTQLTMRTFHTGGVAGATDITGGFDRLKQLIDATTKEWEPWAKISKIHGVVKEIKNEVVLGLDQKVIILIENETGKEYLTKFTLGRKIRVKVGDVVKPGLKLVEGPIDIYKLIKITDADTVKRYILKEIQKLYRAQGITISDKYVEIIVRKILSKQLIKKQNDSVHFIGSLVDKSVLSEESRRLVVEGKIPAEFETQIVGVKKVPLLSSSFLSAASYQETPLVLVRAALAAKVDKLTGLKENLIVGRKIPAGTNYNFEIDGKYDIRDPRTYFQKIVEDK